MHIIIYYTRAINYWIVFARGCDDAVRVAPIDRVCVWKWLRPTKLRGIREHVPQSRRQTFFFLISALSATGFHFFNAPGEIIYCYNVLNLGQRQKKKKKCKTLHRDLLACCTRAFFITECRAIWYYSIRRDGGSNCSSLIVVLQQTFTEWSKTWGDGRGTRETSRTKFSHVVSLKKNAEDPSFRAANNELEADLT